MDNRCTLPFDGHIQVFLQKGTVAGCCKIKHQSFDNDRGLVTDNIVELRRDIINNKRNSQCQECWRIDDIGGPSLRARASTHFRQSINWDLLDPLQQPNKIEISFSNKCQMMCAYCSPQVSSMWQDNIKDFTQFKIPATSFDSHYKLNDLVDVDSLQSIQITGGEPMLSDECINFLMNLKFVSTRQITIITNLSYGQATLEKLLSIINRHPNLIVYASIDAIGTNISRKYFNWDLWNSNFCVLADNLQERKKQFPGVYLMTKSTLGLLNYRDLQKIIEYVLSFRIKNYQGITFDINPLEEHELTSLQSGEIDKTVKIELSSDITTLLSEREKILINKTNDMIKNSNINVELAQRTKQFLTKYIEK
jgi:uncharacterized radical SAM superfamily Fe-S cluster-containing enzyme